jgi:hypothetical protein
MSGILARGGRDRLIDVSSLRVAYDQVIPFPAELFINFHIPGVVAGFVGLAFAISRLQRAATTATNPIEVYMAQYATYWIAFLIPGSLAVSSQIFVYFFWPIYFYYLFLFFWPIYFYLFLRWLGRGVR